MVASFPSAFLSPWLKAHWVEWSHQQVSASQQLLNPMAEDALASIYLGAAREGASRQILPCLFCCTASCAITGRGKAKWKTSPAWLEETY
jgi:hypothetical protein